MGVNKKIGFFPGVFDFVHAGHVRAFKHAKKYCDYLIVGINATPEHKKPTMSVEERIIMIEANKYVDEVIIYNGETELQYLDTFWNIDFRFRGIDHAGTPYYKTNAKFIDIVGDSRFHSSEIRKRCQQL